MNAFIALLVALVAPLVLLPVEHALNYPYIIEELVKAFAVALIILQGRSDKNHYWMFAVLVGILFTVSESILYLSDFFMQGEIELLPIRLLVTGLLHIGTCLIVYFIGRKNRWLLVVGLFISMVVHYYFNYLISGIHVLSF